MAGQLERQASLPVEAASLCTATGWCLIALQLLYSLSKVKLGTSSSFVLLAIALEYLQVTSSAVCFSELVLLRQVASSCENFYCSWRHSSLHLTSPGSLITGSGELQPCMPVGHLRPLQGRAQLGTVHTSLQHGMTVSLCCRAYRVFQRTQLHRLAMAGGVGPSLWLAYSSTQKQASCVTADACSVLQMIVFIVFFSLVVVTVLAVQVLGVFCAMVRGCLIVLPVSGCQTLCLSAASPVCVPAEHQNQQVS